TTATQARYLAWIRNISQATATAAGTTTAQIIGSRRSNGIDPFTIVPSVSVERDTSLCLTTSTGPFTREQYHVRYSRNTFPQLRLSRGLPTETLQFVQNTRRNTFINDVVSVVANYLRASAPRQARRGKIPLL